MTDADALYRVQEFLSSADVDDETRAALARMIALAVSSVATMQRNTALEAQLDRLQQAMIQRELR